MTTLTKPRSIDKNCEICGIPATGYHYNVPSCDGCKTFFRRSVLARITFKCVKKDNQCLASNNRAEGRIRCRSCRYNRCVQQGMDPTAVNTLKVRVSRDVSSVEFDRPCSSGSDEVHDSLRSLKVESPCTENDLQALISYLINIEDQVALIRRDGTDSHRDNELLSRILQPSVFGDLSQYLSIYQQTACEDFKNVNNYMIPQWLVTDISAAVHYANMFNDFQFLPLQSKSEIILWVVFPLMVAMNFYEVCTDNFMDINGISDSRTTSLRTKYGHLLELIKPFLELKVDRTEFLILRTISLFDALLQSVSGSSLITEKVHSTKTFYVRHLYGHMMIKNGPYSADVRLQRLSDLFQTFILRAQSQSHVISDYNQEYMSMK